MTVALFHKYINMKVALFHINIAYSLSFHKKLKSTMLQSTLRKWIQKLMHPTNADTKIILQVITSTNLI